MCPAILVSECLAVVTLALASLVWAALVVPLVVTLVVTSLVAKTALACALVIALTVATGPTILIVSPKQVSKEPNDDTQNIDYSSDKIELTLC